MMNLRDPASRLGMLATLGLVYSLVSSPQRTVDLYLAYSRLEDQLGTPLYGSAWMPVATACLKTVVLVLILAPVAHWLGWIRPNTVERDLRWALLAPVAQAAAVTCLLVLVLTVGTAAENSMSTDIFAGHLQVVALGAWPAAVVGSVLAVVVGPAIEELLYRRYLWALFEGWGTPTALALTSVLFGLSHRTQSPALMVLTMLSGLLFGWMRIRGGLGAAVLGHVLWNATVEGFQWYAVLFGIPGQS